MQLTGVVRDEANSVVPGASVYIYVLDTTTPASIFQDRELTVAAANPITAGAAGEWLAYAADGTLYDLKIVAAGHSDVIIPDVGNNDPRKVVILAGRAGGQTIIGGTAASEILSLRATSHSTAGSVKIDLSGFVFNDSGAALDARFEGDTDANLVFIQGSTDRVGIGNAAPSVKLDVTGSLKVSSAIGCGGSAPGATVGGQVTVFAATGYCGIGGIRMNGADTVNTIWQTTASADLAITTNGGKVIIGGGVSQANLVVTAAGVIETPTMHNNGGTGATQAITSGTYTPTITGLANVASTSGASGSFDRVGSRVNGKIYVTVDPTTGSTFTRFAFTLPVASNLANIGDLCGSDGYNTGTAVVMGIVYGDVTNDRAEVAFTCDAGAAAQLHIIQFSYDVK